MPATDQEIYLAERAKTLLADDAFAEALTAVRMDALLALATVDAAKPAKVRELQAVVRVTESIKGELEAMITRTGARDGGVSMTATRKANTAN